MYTIEAIVSILFPAARRAICTVFVILVTQQQQVTPFLNGFRIN